MCEQMLLDTLEGKIQLNVIFKWLVNQSSEDDDFNDLENNKCVQSDFISYFLNFIHDVQSLNNRSVEIPQKASTPKRIERFTSTHDENTGTPVIKRRSALFENVTPRSHTEHSPSIMYSTPKMVKSHIDGNYTSPLSPLYNRQNFTTPKSRYSNSTPKSTPGLCLGDFIICNNTKSSSSKKKAQRSLNENLFNIDEENNAAIKTRRINPTSLAHRKYNNANFRKSDNSFTFENGTDEIIDHSNGQRSFLLEERMKIISRKSTSDANLPTLTVSKALAMSKKTEITPCFKLVTFKSQLDILMLIYSFMLNNNFILNLASELYFLIFLLLGREYEENEDTSPNNSNLGVSPLLDININFNCDTKNDTKLSSNAIFGTIHNRVYFSCTVLQNQIHILKIFDRSTLRLLVENKRLKCFTSASFTSQLLQIYENKTEKTTEVLEQLQSNVCFISDTDNRDNFPNDPSFHAFRKQRDLFYEILRIWENNHLQDEWNFVVALGGKIKALLSMHADTMNLVHFARLFKAQLLMSTCGSHEDSDNSISENQLSFLSAIPNVDAEKLLRLKSRIVGKQSVSGINSIPVFNGYQEFYRDFILVSASQIFNRHLNDALISEIVDLNNTKFSYSDIDDNDASVDSSTQNAYTLCIKSLRILAKFLGFLESLPYKNDNSQPSQNVISCQIRIRNEIQPGLNLKSIINNSINNKSLIVTIPWVTKYLSMLDYVMLRLSYFEEILCTLFQIYYLHLNETSNNQKSHYNQKTILLLKLCLGWLFELPHFPEGSYYKFLSQKLPTKTKQIVQTNNNNSTEIIFLDELDLVDQNVLYICCPYLQDIKKVLSDNINMLNNSNVTIKHITPLTAVESPTDLSNKRVQHQLEEAFFNGQPVSVRKTVEFISERVASACVKEICNEIVPSYKKKALIDFKEILNAYSIPDDISNDPEEFVKMKALINIETGNFANSSVKAARERIINELKSFSNARIISAVDSLLATDVLKQAKDTCVSIATRMCEERVQQWNNSHVNIGIFIKDFDMEVKQFLGSNFSRHTKQKPRFALPLYGKSIKHNPQAYSGVELLENIRSCCWSVLEKPMDITVDMITDLLKSIRQSINERCDLNDCVLVLVNRMLVDFYILLIGHRADITDANIVTDFCSVWQQNHHKSDYFFKTLISPRNILMIANSSTIDLSWKSFEKFLSTLLSEKLLTHESLELQVLAIDKNKLNEATLRHLSNCLETISVNI